MSFCLELLKKYKARSTSELYDKCNFGEWQQVCEITNYHEILKTSLELYIKYNLDLQREDMWKYACKQSSIYFPDKEQFQEFETIFKLNKIIPHNFAYCLKSILKKSDAKINCLRLIGTANSGKTLLANCICEPFITCYNNNHGSENEFYLSNMLNKSIILCEELYITIATAEDMKSVLGGQPIDIAKKFNEKQLLSRTPVVITSNYSKFGRGHLAPIDEHALSLRCHTFDFNVSYKPACRLTSEQFYLYMLSVLTNDDYLNFI